MPRHAAIIYSREFEKVNFGPDHPFRSERFSSTINYFKKLFNVLVIEPELIDETDLLEVHEKEYVELVKKLSISGEGALSIDTPAFKGMFEWALWYCSGTIKALNLLLNEKFEVVFNPCGGLHHAKRDSDGGFCIFNDVALVARKAYKSGLKVAIVDYDAHAGDGTMHILYEEPILKISVHEDPFYLYPGDGFIDQVGENRGYGYTINIPLPPYSGDDIFIDVFKDIILPALELYNPEILIIQSGVDGHYSDPLTHLRYTSEGYIYVSRLLRSLNIPTIILGGGGYNLELLPRLWAIIFSIHADLELPKTIKEQSTKSDSRVWKLYGEVKKSILKHPFFKINGF